MSTAEHLKCSIVYSIMAVPIATSKEKYVIFAPCLTYEPDDVSLTPLHDT